MHRRVAYLVASVVCCALCSACGTAGSIETDRQADVLATAISYPRQHDAAGLARAALNTTLGRSGNFAVIEATDLHADSYSDPAVRLVIRIHVPATHVIGMNDIGHEHKAYDACYRMEFLMPSSAVRDQPERVDCPAGAAPIAPPPAPPRPELPKGTSAALTKVLTHLPPAPSQAQAEAATRAVLPSQVRVTALVDGRRIVITAAVGSGEETDCLIVVRDNGRLYEPQGPTYEDLMEHGCRAR
ncbi:MAG: hypothetical protein J2O46_07465 [Nocardioides sp.]|nr:hypothetical protein [Nocardioides sp.]